MGKLIGGPWGRVKGKVGNLVASNLNGETILKAAPNPSDAPPSPEQELHRNKFALAIKSVKPMGEVLKYTFRNGKGGSALSLAAGYTLENAITDDNGEIAIDFSRVLVSRGTLPSADFAEVSKSGTTLTFTWDTETGYGSAADSDKVIIVVHCPEKNECFSKMNIATRKDGTVTVDVKKFAGKEVHTYLAFITANNKKSSDSMFVGSFNLQPLPKNAGRLNKKAQGSKKKTSKTKKKQAK
jgi:hypothetical protein